MPASSFETLYGAAAENEPYSSASIILATTSLPAGDLLAYGSIGQPSTPGYAPITGRVEDIFPDPQIVAGQAVRLVSRQISLRNTGVGDVQLTGACLVIWQNPSLPIVVAVVPVPLLWKRGMRIAGRLHVTSLITTQP